MKTMQYDHTQTAPLYLLPIIVGLSMVVAAWLTPQPFVQTILLFSGGLVLLLATCFRQLTVQDEGDHLLIQFGPLPLFRRRIAYSDIQRAEQSRTTILDGWGIHLSPGGGWTWNLWGRDCVNVYLSRGRKLRIGTDDPEALEAFLKQRASDEFFTPARRR